MTRKLFEDYISEISKEIIEEQYLVLNKSYQECSNFFGISTSMFMRLLKYYNISKPKNLCTAVIKQRKFERYGDENFNNHAKRTATNIEKYGVENQFQRKDLFPQIYQTKVDKYGTYNNIDKNMATRAEHYGSVEASYEAQKLTYKDTCLAKYGVTNTAQLQEIKNKIKDSLASTFVERYGVENYWAMPDAKRSNGSKNSKANLLFASKLTEAGIAFEREVGIDGKIFDFKINDIVVEINPAATHNATWSIYNPKEGLEKAYHKNKSAIASQHNLHCIHVFDWDNTDCVIRLLQSPSKVVGARKCQVKEISIAEAADFLNKYHIQGYAKDKIRLGLFYNNILVSVMTFGKPRFNKNYEYELIRYCTSEIGVSGGGEKLFKYFVTNFNPTSIVSYCDLSKFNGQIYNKLGFRKIYKAGPSLHWYNMKTKQHILDSLLRSQGFDRLFGTAYGKGSSNEALMLTYGFVEIYDCGQATYGWTATN